MKRSKSDRVIGGVCGGIGESMGVEPWLFRILFLVFGGFWIYIIMWLFIEEEN